jgi:hypothetical protein
MGRIGFHVEPGEWRPELAVARNRISLIDQARSRLAEPVPEPVATPVGVPPQAKRDSLLDRSLAWLSYYLLVFVAFAVFLPGTTVDTLAGMREAMAPMLGDMATSSPAAWPLRGGVHFNF